MDDKTNNPDQNEGENKDIKNSYKTAIDFFAGINNKAAILSTQSSFLSKSLFGPSMNNSFLDISKQYSKMSSVYAGLPNIKNIIGESAALSAARDANLTMSLLFGKNSILEMSKAMQASNSFLSANNSFAALSNPLSSHLKFENNISKLSTLATINKPLTAFFAASSNFGRMAEYTLQAEKNFATFSLAQLGSKIAIDNTLQPFLSETITNYSKSFSDLWKSYEASPKTFIDISPTLLRIPPIEYFNTSTLLEKISVEENNDTDEDILTSDLLIENEETLTMLLPKLNPELLNLWIGANQALESNNVEKVRHFAASIRELFTNVLHSLSPDNDFLKWTTNPKEDVQNNKITRKARLSYIYRDVNNAHFKSFIEADVTATLRFMDLFQEGTHSLKSKLTEKQLVTIKMKAESTLKYLLQTYFEFK